MRSNGAAAIRRPGRVSGLRGGAAVGRSRGATCQRRRNRTIRAWRGAVSTVIGGRRDAMDGAVARGGIARLSRRSTRRAGGRRGPCTPRSRISRRSRARTAGLGRPACVVSSGETTVHVTGTRQGRPQSGIRAGRRRHRSPRWPMPAVIASVGHRRHRRPHRRRRRPRRFHHDRARAGRRASAPRAVFSPTTTPTRSSRRLAISSSHGPDRHQRRRPPSHSPRRIVDHGHRCFHATRFSRSCASGCTIPPACANCSRFSRCRATSGPRSSGTSRRWSVVRRSDPDPRAPLRPSGKNGSLRRPAADAPGRLRLRHARTSARAGRRRHLRLRARTSTRRCRAIASSCASSASRMAGASKGRIIRILERANERIVGRYDRDENGMGYVAPFDRRVLMDIFIPPGQEGGASPGEMVTVELTRWPTSTRTAIGRVTEVLGDIDAPGVDTEIIIRKYGIPDAHAAGRRGRGGPPGDRRSPSATCAAGPTSAAVPTVTIDGEHARDFDDAITIEKLPNGHYWLGVHIADVSHYVQRRQRARSRGLRARHVGLLSRARRPHVPVGAVDRTVQSESARRPAGAIVPDGNRSPRPRRPVRISRRRHQQRRSG